MSQWDQLTGEDSSSSDEYSSRRPKGNWNTRKPRQSPSRPQTQSSAPRSSQQQPADVSDNVWGLAEQFIEEGKAFFGRNIPVNRAEFSKRLAEQINSDPDVKNMLSPLEWNAAHTHVVRTRLPEDQFAKAVDKVNAIVAEMITRFWSNLEVGTALNGGLQFRFLHDDWDELWYQAEMNLEVKGLVKGLADGTVSKRPANYRMVSEESRNAHRLKRLQIRLRREDALQGDEVESLTDEKREAFAAWVADRKRTRDSVAN